MASKAMNEAVARLREQQAEQHTDLQRRHGAQESALVAVTAAVAAVDAARREREVVLARANAAVTEAEDGRDGAVAVLARLTSLESAAELAGPSVAEVRRAVQRVPKDQVGQRAEAVLASAAVGRGRGGLGRGRSTVGGGRVVRPPKGSRPHADEPHDDNAQRRGEDPEGGPALGAEGQAAGPDVVDQQHLGLLGVSGKG